jgi:hypothetical protein
MSIRRRILSTALLVAALGMAPARAAVIDVSTPSNTLLVGDTVSVNFNISGLTAAPDASLSAFDLDIRFDQAAMQFTGFGFADPASGLNQLDLAEAGSFPFLGDAFINGSLIDAYGLSGNSAALLDAGQADSFTFLVLHFTAIATSPVSTVAIDLSDPAQLFVDSQAARLAATIGAPGVQFAINAAVPPVPEPAALPLFGVGLLVLAAMHRPVRRRIRRPAAATATAVMLLSLAGAMPASAQAPAPAVTAPAPEPATAGALTAVIVDVQGQRMLLRLPGGATRWVTVAAPLGKSLIGKKVSGTAVARGDTHELRDFKLLD